MKKIAVIGLGYVGLPLALMAEEKAFDVVGIDLSKAKLSQLQKRQSPIDDADATKRLQNSKIKFSNDFALLNDRDIAIICVPTPVNEDKMPDLSIVKNASVSAAKKLKNGSLLIIESTINPGVCDEIIIPAIEAETKHKVGKTLHIAHCPERINPGDPKWHVGNINRVLGANSEEALNIAYEFYSNLIDAKIKKMGSLKEAEAVKIVENSFRDINIAFVNELAMSFDKLGINVKNVIDGAATKPFAFMAHYPGIGVGGHCIPVDPYYLIEYAQNNGFEHHFLKLARSINENMPLYAVDSIEKKLIETGSGNLENKKVTVLGLAYKPNVADDRESPAYSVINYLKERGSVVSSYDPYVPENSDCQSLEQALLMAEVVVLVTAHDEFKKVGDFIHDGIILFFDGRDAIEQKTINKLKDNEVEIIKIGAL